VISFCVGKIVISAISGLSLSCRFCGTMSSLGYEPAAHNYGTLSWLKFWRIAYRTPTVKSSFSC
jgi:hypothetical protein